MHTTVTDAELANLREIVGRMLPAYLADLVRLVDVDCGSYSKEGVDEIGRWLALQLADLGAAVEIDANDGLGDCIVGVLHGAGTETALLIGHLDTVFPDGTVAERPYSVRDGRAYGPGVDDMKAGLLGGLYALRALQEMAGTPADWLPFRELVFVGNPDEEIGSPASTPIIRRFGERADVALVLESARDNGDIVSARKGIAEYRLQVRGRAAHAGVEPHKGRSAILEAAHKTLALTALNGRWPGVTVNVGVVQGGTRTNVVAEECELHVDLRAVTRPHMEAAEAAIEEIAARTAVPDVTCTVERRHRWWPMEKGPATAALADAAIGLADRLGFTLADAATGGASDANTTSGMGVPTLDGLGPVGGADHAPGEYVELDSIVPRVTLLAALLLSIGRSGAVGASADQGERKSTMARANGATRGVPSPVE